MLIDSDDRRSDPNERDIATRIASPRAASHAPRAKKINRTNGLFKWVVLWVNIVKPASVRRILSVARRTISKWVRCIRNRVREKITGRGRRERIEGNIAGGHGAYLWFTRPMLLVMSFTSWAIRRQCELIFNFQS